MVSSFFVTAIKISQSFAPALDNDEGKLGIPNIVLTSRLSDIFFNLSFDSSKTVTSNPSLESLSAISKPTSPAPQIIDFI